MSFTPLLKKLAERYHVYGIVMRSSGITSKVAADGEIDWSAQWCDDIVQFAYDLDIDKFIYLGKCHGSMPGWKILQEHPEMLKAYIPISMIPGSHLLSSPNLMKMIGLRNEENGLLKFIQATVRKPEITVCKLYGKPTQYVHHAVLQQPPDRASDHGGNDRKQQRRA